MMEFHKSSNSQEFRNIYSISRLNREVRTLLESGFPLLWVEAEISNLARPASGHIYFSLKDEKAQIRCAMFRNRNLNLGFSPQNGMQVLVRAKITAYEPRGDLQLVVEHMEEAGDGALRRAFEELKQRLDKEGLFDASHKKPVPTLPNQVGVITSPSGAAVRDVITTLKRRFPSLPVIIYPVAVQGESASNQIAEMIQRADKRSECDVLILCRGGGSLEDLWAFNDEVIARAIFNCSIPIVSGIGHEIDFTIADFVSDQRAATPTGAAELISPNQQEWLTRLSTLQQRLNWLIKNQLRQRQNQTSNLFKRLQHPGYKIRNINQRLDELEQRLSQAQQNTLRHARLRIKNVHNSLLNHNPQQKLIAYQSQNDGLQKRLITSMLHTIKFKTHELSKQAHSLNAVSPLATLSRGYAIVMDEQDQIICKASQVKKGDQIKSRLAEGLLYSQVIKVNDHNE